MSREDTVFVGGLSYSATTDDLFDEFQKYGTVTEANVVKDRDTGDSRGFAFVKFESSQEARDAIDGANDVMEIKGKVVSCSLARARGERGGFGGGRGGARGGRGRGSPGGYGQGRYGGGDRRDYGGGDRREYGTGRGGRGGGYGRDYDRNDSRGYRNQGY